MEFEAESVVVNAVQCSLLVITRSARGRLSGFGKETAIRFRSRLWFPLPKPDICFADRRRSAARIRHGKAKQEGEEIGKGKGKGTMEKAMAMMSRKRDTRNEQWRERSIASTMRVI